MPIAPGQSLSILMVASEAVPFAKTGGLADVSASLTAALGRLGHRVTLVVPLYREVGWVGSPTERFNVTIGGQRFDVGFVEQPLSDGARVVFIECDPLYDRDGLYGHSGHDHPDNALRFAMLARGALEQAIRAETPPSIIHAHDWQAGLVPVYARTMYAGHPSLSGVRAVFTIHNIAYQGMFAESTLPALDLPPEVYAVDGLEFWGQVSLLKGGINFSDLVTTVSRRYAREILTPEFGYGFEGIVSARRARLRGILNGIDVEQWGPEDDGFLPASFSAGNLDGKRVAKRALLERFGLRASKAALARPVVGMISRLVYQKGFDLVAEVIDELPALGATFVILGTGDPVYEQMWKTAAIRHPETIAARIGYDDALAHLIEGGADMFLMPSRYEPCGLNQMYSMRYGTVPVVRAIGGLDDAVDQYDEKTGRGTGFKFSDYSSAAMLGELRRAIDMYADRRRWRAIQLAGMRQDYSWTVSANAYVREYEAVLRDDPPAGWRPGGDGR